MRKMLLISVSLLAMSAWALAQQSYPSAQDQSTKSSGQTTVQGCLSRSGSSFTLTDKSGTTYQLAGDTSKLSDHIGHEVQIQGKTAEPAQNPNAVGEAPSNSKSTIDVSSVKHIASTCSSNSEKSNQPMTEKPPAPPHQP